MQADGDPTPPRVRAGMLIVGLGGGNGVTALAGHLANQRKLSWEAAPPWGRKTANYLGCITQLPSKGGSGGYRERYPLADMNDAVIGGWDIRATPMGRALYDARILDYDLVRQIQDEMEKFPIMKGVWDPDFIGESQHATANHALPLMTRQESLDHLRQDIRNWKATNDVDGHTTVIWSASVERPSDLCCSTAQELLAAIEENDKEISPSVLYATAAALEGCSFVNGGSQNTLCPGLLKLAASEGCYVLGTDFKAGQTKFKTAAVEYIRELGLCPKVIASSNHLGNNDMLNLTTKKTLDAKMRVKGNIFGPWKEDIDHQVRVMYTPLIADEKRDIVEYTSLGFMGCTHTMLTYTRAMDSALCVPLMIDAAVWCDYFSRCGISQDRVAKATAYLFKVPEGAAQGVDPGFFKQMRALETVLSDTSTIKNFPSAPSAGGRGAFWGIGAVCAGISCLDMELCSSTQGSTAEAINTFKQTSYCPGGSSPQACMALTGLGVRNVVALTKMGCDGTGDTMTSILKQSGVNCDHIIRDEEAETALAVLPIFKNGGRGCYVNLAANTNLTAAEVLAVFQKVMSQEGGSWGRCLIHYGYPHFTPLIQGKILKKLLVDMRAAAGDMISVVSLDLNGVDGRPEVTSTLPILEPALKVVDVLHANLEEALLITGMGKATPPKDIAGWFLQRGVGIVAITLGADGAYVAANGNSKLIRNGLGDGRSFSSSSSPLWAAAPVRLPAFAVTEGSTVNSNGAGDAFISGLALAVTAAALNGTCMSLEHATRFALLSARQRVDSSTREGKGGAADADALLRQAMGPANSLPPTLGLLRGWGN
ncbi:unnamed protein product [Chrysoparadoxa australica]